MTLDERRRTALLEATLREIVRLHDVSHASTTAVSFDDVFDADADARAWRSALRRARGLVQP
jgi:hypothetical protein